jgi:hypothetical protein
MSRIQGLIGVIITSILGYLAWISLGGGTGLMTNVVRNMALGALAIPFLYSLLCLLGDPGKQHNKNDPKT